MKHPIHKTTLSSNDIFLTSSNIINELCQPLKKIGITYFTYIKNFDDGSQVNLSNSSEWIEHYYKYKLYQSSIFDKSSNIYFTGRYLWPEESALEVFHHGRQYFDSDHGITIIENSQKTIEYFFFSGSRKNRYLRNLYLNHQDLLDNFIQYFKAKLAKILKEAELSRILIPRNVKETLLDVEGINQFLSNEITAAKQQLLSNLNFTVKQNEEDDTPKHQIWALLTPREMAVVTCLMAGKSAKESAKQLVISNRTVETHLENIKMKFNCRTKLELINKLLTSQNTT